MRTSERLRRTGRRPLPPPVLLAYLAVMATLGYTGLSLVQKLAGTIIASLPVPASDLAQTRVQRWANLTNDGEVRGWLARSDVPKPAIPIAAILGATPGSMTAALGTPTAPSPPEVGQPAATTSVFKAGAGYRTVCVRLCDGAYFPVSFATTADRFEADEAVCQASCGTPVRLFAYRNPGERPDSMVDRAGRPYRNLQSAFRFRAGYDSRCSCRAQPWEQLARDRHRLYSLGVQRPGNPAAEAEIAQIRERLAALSPEPAPAPPPPVYAAAAPAASGVASDAWEAPAPGARPANRKDAVAALETSSIAPALAAGESPAAAPSIAAPATAEPAPAEPAAAPAPPAQARAAPEGHAATAESPPAPVASDKSGWTITVAAAEPAGTSVSSQATPATAGQTWMAATELSRTSGPVVAPAAGDMPPAPDIEVPFEVDSTAEPLLDEVEPDDLTVQGAPSPKTGVANGSPKSKAGERSAGKATQEKSTARAEKSRRAARVAAGSQRLRAAQGRVVVVRYFYVRRFASRTPMEEQRRNLTRGSF